MELKATCGACGSADLKIPDPGRADQMVRCSKCGADVGDKAAIQKKLKEAAQKQVDKIKADFKNLFKK